MEKKNIIFFYNNLLENYFIRKQMEIDLRSTFKKNYYYTACRYKKSKRRKKHKKKTKKKFLQKKKLNI